MSVAEFAVIVALLLAVCEKLEVFPKWLSAGIVKISWLAIVAFAFLLFQHYL